MKTEMEQIVANTMVVSLSVEQTQMKILIKATVL